MAIFSDISDDISATEGYFANNFYHFSGFIMSFQIVLLPKDILSGFGCMRII